MNVESDILDILTRLTRLEENLSTHRHTLYDGTRPLGDIIDSIIQNRSAVTPRVLIGDTLITLLTAQNLSSFVPGNNRISAYAAGTAYSLTTSAALLDFGTTDPSITITPSGTYLLFARVHLKYNGATFAANRTVTLKIRKTSGTPADVANTPATFITQVVTTFTATAGVISLPVVVYAASAGDVLEVWGSVDTGPTAGSLDAVEAELIAIRIV